jgi:hypothetical protein
VSIEQLSNKNSSLHAPRIVRSASADGNII